MMVLIIRGEKRVDKAIELGMHSWEVFSFTTVERALKHLGASRRLDLCSPCPWKEISSSRDRSSSHRNRAGIVSGDLELDGHGCNVDTGGLRQSVEAKTACIRLCSGPGRLADIPVIRCEQLSLLNLNVDVEAWGFEVSCNGLWDV